MRSRGAAIIDTPALEFVSTPTYGWDGERVNFTSVTNLHLKVTQFLMHTSPRSVSISLSIVRSSLLKVRGSARFHLVKLLYLIEGDDCAMTQKKISGEKIHKFVAFLMSSGLNKSCVRSPRVLQIERPKHMQLFMLHIKLTDPRI